MKSVPISGYYLDGTINSRMFDIVQDDEGREFIELKVNKVKTLLPLPELGPKVDAARQQLNNQ